jgi:hypothetical protein
MTTIISSRIGEPSITQQLARERLEKATGIKTVDNYTVYTTKELRETTAALEAGKQVDTYDHARFAVFKVLEALDAEDRTHEEPVLAQVWECAAVRTRITRRRNMFSTTQVWQVSISLQGVRHTFEGTEWPQLRWHTQQDMLEHIEKTYLKW